MNTLKDKSLFNKDAADILIKNHFYGPSIHCSYYRCIQYMLHCIYLKPLAVKSDFTQKDIGTHVIAINLIKAAISKMYMPDKGELASDLKYFVEQIYELKKLRKNADYDESVIKQEDSIIAQKKADAITDIIAKYLKL